ncbi:DUF4124 domain-containing protein [bacterium]|nr:DUF4124 domain-containing protein [bacterium]
MKFWKIVMMLFLPLIICAQIYYWVDENGVEHYSSTPPPEQAAVKDLQQSDTMTAEEIEKDQKALQEQIRAQEAEKRKNRKLVMYTTSWCKHCKAAKAYCDANKIPYVSYDIETSPKHEAEYRALGGGGVPLLVVGNAKLNGWSAKWVRKQLDLDKG